MDMFFAKQTFVIAFSCKQPMYKKHKHPFALPLNDK